MLDHIVKVDENLNTVGEKRFFFGTEKIPSNNVVIGYGSTSAYSNCVVIGVNKHSTADNQLIIGNDEIMLSRPITDDEFKIILDTFKSIS